MAIVKMNHFTLLAFESQREALLKALQRTGLVHFKNISAGEEQETSELKRLSYGEDLAYAESELAKVTFALSRIEQGKQSPAQDTPELSFAEFDSFIQNYNYADICGQIKRLDEQLKQLNSERSKLNTENEALCVWKKLDVSSAELNGAATVTCLLGTFPRQGVSAFLDALADAYPCSYAETFDTVREDITALIIAVNDDADGVASLAKTHGFTKAGLSLDKTPVELIGINNKRIAEIEKEIAALNEQTTSMAAHYTDLNTTRDYFKTLVERSRVCENFLGTKETFMIEGWFAQNDTERFKTAVTSVCGESYSLDIEEVERDSEEVPIKLKNNAFISAFQDVTEMYSMPKYNEVDPTPMLTPFYILFFGAMFGDVGYGAVLALGAGLMYFKSASKGKPNLFFRFFTILGIASIVMGVLYGSIFGVTFFAPMTHAETGEPAPILDLQGNVMMILILSVAVGVLHIFVGLFMKGFVLIKNGKVLDAVFDSLFLILAVGGIIAFALASMFEDYSQYASICGIVAIAAIIGLICTQGRASPSIGGKIGNGIYSVYSLTGFIGDFVSYTRLMALALASAYIAYSFNLMAGLVAGVDSLSELSGSGYIRLIPAAIIAVFGAGLNMGLGALGAYVHSCRLQYVEYFGKFYEGGGVPFRPFELKNSYINISKGGKES